MFQIYFYFAAFFWQQLKPLIRGKILYTPDTKATQQLMQMVNMSFSPFLEVILKLNLSNLYCLSYFKLIKILFSKLPMFLIVYQVQRLSEKWLQNKDGIRSVLTNKQNQKLFTVKSIKEC